MTRKAILFGSIGTIVETSELQRKSFNRAFGEAGLDWNWEPDEYRELLKKSGGRRRIADYAKTQASNVDAEAIHRRKTEIFDQAMLEQGLSPRSGVADVIHQAKENGVRLGFVTTTSRDNVDAVFEALRGQVAAADFDFIGDASMVSSGKPHPEIYELALGELGVKASDCVAIEDTAISAEASVAAGIKTVAFAGAYADSDGFDGDLTPSDDLTYERLIASV